MAQLGAMPARLNEKFAKRSLAELLKHFRSRNTALFSCVDRTTASKHFPTDTSSLLARAELIVNGSKWELAGFGTLEFTGDNCWRRDPLGTKDWGLDHHADIILFSNDGADIRALWELNRFGHAVTLACAFTLTRDERYAETFFAQIEEWTRQNPYGLGANWQCAMEVALRAINLLASFDLVRDSAACTEDRLALMLQLFDHHGRFISDNSEFSYLATSNHYLSDVVGLFWIGSLLPELEHAAEWSDFGRSEILSEMHKQVLPDGSDFEASTGYHKFVAEMLLYSFLLARKNGIAIEQRYWQRLRTMFDYLHGIMRPDGRMPLVGDADGSQIIAVVKRDADDAAYILELAAVVFDEPSLSEFGELAPEVLWLLGEKAIEKLNSMQISPAPARSAAFADAGTYVMRDGDLYLHFNANDTGVKGRGSHAHNDALSVEVSAFGRSFIVDPGSCVYNLDRDTRHRFRSTAYHSTIMIDGEEQNSTRVDMPFVLGNEADPQVIEWTTTAEGDTVSAEHYGYTRLADSIVHRRTVRLEKKQRYWTIIDELSGHATHEARLSFHLALGISADREGRTAKLRGGEGRCLLLHTGLDPEFDIVPSAVSNNYGHSEPSSMLVWRLFALFPLTIRTIVVPVHPTEKLDARLELLGRLADNNGS